MNIDISIYGHMTIDTIHDKEKIYEFGGIANVWRVFKEINFDATVSLEPVHYGEAIIYIDRDTSKRYSDAVLNMKEIKPTIAESLINHILYINEIENISFLDELTGFNVADTCKGKDLDFSRLENINLLLGSDEDFDNINKVTKNFGGIFVLHNSAGCEIGYKENIFKYEMDSSLHLKNINVLGAGDIFAAYLIKEIYEKKIYQSKNNLDMYKKIIEIIESVHKSTSIYLKEKNIKV